MRNTFLVEEQDQKRAERENISLFEAVIRNYHYHLENQTEDYADVKNYLTDIEYRIHFNKALKKDLKENNLQVKRYCQIKWEWTNR